MTRDNKMQRCAYGATGVPSTYPTGALIVWPLTEGTINIYGLEWRQSFSDVHADYSTSSLSYAIDEFARNVECCRPMRLASSRGLDVGAEHRWIDNDRLFHFPERASSLRAKTANAETIDSLSHADSCGKRNENVSVISTAFPMFSE